MWITAGKAVMEEEFLALAMKGYDSPKFPLSLRLNIMWLAAKTHESTSFERELSSVQSLSRVQLFVTLWTAAHQASLSINNSQRLLKLMSIESVTPSNHLILCHPLLLPPSIFPSNRVFSSASVFASGGQRIGISASAAILPMNIQH